MIMLGCTGTGRTQPETEQISHMHNNNNLYLPSAVFIIIAQVLVGPSIKPRKEIL